MVSFARLKLQCIVLSLAVLPAQTPAAAQSPNAKPPAPTSNLAVSAALVTEKEKEKEDPLFRGMEYRPIGPFRGGRSLTAAGVPGDPTTYYFGSTGGGVWKSTDGALTWTSVFDNEGTSSIGSIAIAQSEPTTIYVGTGEACIRGNISHGDGVYRSLDAGKTWTNIGLHDSRAIGRIIVHPRNPGTVFVAALGHPYGPNQERGVFRTTDGGKNWEKVLYKDENTGAIDIRFDPNNPNILFAALWQARRMAWRLDDGGPGSGLYRSDDGGSTWKQITEHGLPKPPYGRVGVSVAANSERVYALIEAKDGGLYRSDDGGEEWQLVSDNHALRQRPWYYMHVFADPQDPDTVYVMNVDAYKSTDGGRSFNKMTLPHGDNHNLWIDPRNPQRMAASNDGGVTVSINEGKSWTRQGNQPTAQFYHVVTDTRTPYYVYGAQQDSSTVGIASRSEDGEIGRADWYAVGGGEAGYIAPYPPDPNIVFAGDYEGNLTRYDRKIGQTKNIGVNPELSDGQGAATLEHRFQWTAPLIISPHDPDTIYYGGERVFKSTNQGVSWEAISPDLTRNDKTKQQPSGGAVTIDDTGTEYYDTVFTIAESPVTKGVIWAGTDDGLIQLTRDGGKSWSNVTPKDMPEWSRISLIDASPHDAGTAYVAVDRHQFDDLRPYIYKTSDYGATWSRLGKGIPDTTFVRAVREDPKKRGLLYAGTEMGVFVSFNDGADWRPMQLNLPRVPIHDLVVKNDDLVLATHGRSFWILDDVSPLRQFTEQIPPSDVFLYKPAAAYRLYSGEGPPKPVVTGKNPPLGAVIYFYVKQAPKGDNAAETTIEILDSKGTLVRKYSSKRDVPLEEPRDPDDKKREKQIKLEDGMNRLVWDLHFESARSVPGYFLYEYKDGALGPMALTGPYQVRLTAAGKTLTESFEIKLDPRVKVAQADLDKQFELLSSVHTQLNRVYDAANQIEDVRTQVKALTHRLPQGAAAQPVHTAAGSLDLKLTGIRAKLVNLTIKANEDDLAYAPGIDGKLAYLAMAVASQSDSAPTDAEYKLFDRLKKQSDEYLAQWSGIEKEDVAAFQKQLAGQGIPAIVVAPAEALSGEGEGQ